MRVTVWVLLTERIAAAALGGPCGRRFHRCGSVAVAIGGGILLWIFRRDAVCGGGDRFAQRVVQGDQILLVQGT